MSKLGDRAAVLDIRGVAARAEDAADLHLGVSKYGGNERARRVVGKGDELDRNSLGRVSV